MAVYVDNAEILASVSNGPKVHTSRWCHMMADTLPELLAFASKIGLRRSWLQVSRSGVRFDLTAGKRRLAVATGAIEIDFRSDEWLRVCTCARRQYAEAVEIAG